MVKEGTREGLKRPEHCSPRESLASSKESKPDSIYSTQGGSSFVGSQCKTTIREFRLLDHEDPNGYARLR